ncbi:hypothetical protein ACGFX8_19525 [Streptomyces sp. NPDC048362]|uniref:hypothetical protein n=1 Tax=Streptomyces sp. NPDC048362 TaxID=3365539 RepID=UPI0037133342
MTAVHARSAATPPGLVAPGERGATRIDDRVVAKIATQAAREALAPLPPGAAAPHATVVVRQETARVRLRVDLGYPCDIGARCGAVRRRVRERLEALVNMEAPDVAVRVEGLHPAPALGASHGRTS